jgi:hypothetical protein
MGIAHSWGIKLSERDIVFPCDDIEYKFDTKCTLYRAITIEAPAEEIYLWLCQLRYSSCSYDLIGSSRKKALKSSLYNQRELEINQTVMDIFELISFEKNAQITVSIKPNSGYPFESLIVSYMIIKQESSSCRLICKANMKYKQNLAGYFAKKILPWGDLVMMRKQMLNIKRFTENNK